MKIYPIKEYTDFGILKGRIILDIQNKGDDLIFTTEEGLKVSLSHQQDCCETVRLEEIIGDLDDLVGHPVLAAEEVSSDDEPEPEPETDDCYESHTWTFYKISTIRGSVTLRWLGTSNGYYSEIVDCMTEFPQDWVGKWKSIDGSGNENYRYLAFRTFLTKEQFQTFETMWRATRKEKTQELGETFVVLATYEDRGLL